MPPGTKLRNLRVEDDLWRSAREIAVRRGENLSDVMRAALAEYVAAHS